MPITLLYNAATDNLCGTLTTLEACCEEEDCSACCDFYTMTPSGVANVPDFCSTCEVEINGTPIVIGPRVGPGPVEATCGFFFQNSCEWVSPFEHPCLQGPGVAYPPVALLAIRSIGSGQWDVLIQISILLTGGGASVFDSAAWRKTYTGPCSTLSTTFTPDDLCDLGATWGGLGPAFAVCDWSNASITLDANC